MLGMISYSDPAHRREKSRLQQERDSVCFTTFIHRVREGGGIPPIQRRSERASNEGDPRERREEKGVKKLSETGSSGEEFGQEGAGEGPTDGRTRRADRKSYWTVHTVGLTYLPDSRIFCPFGLW